MAAIERHEHPAAAPGPRARTNLKSVSVVVPAGTPRAAKRSGHFLVGGGGGVRSSTSAAASSSSSSSKDRHSKVQTSKGLRDRRVRLSVSTALQFYDIQDRLGFQQPSRVFEWLIDKAKPAIQRLPPNNPNPNP